MSKTIDAALALQAVKNAISNQNPDTKGLILHSDLGRNIQAINLRNILRNCL